MPAESPDVSVPNPVALVGGGPLGFPKPLRRVVPGCLVVAALLAQGQVAEGQVAEGQLAQGQPARGSAPAALRQVSLDLSAPGDCATAAELEARVQRRSTELSIVPAPAPHAVTVRIAPTAEGRLRATLLVEQPGEPAYRRAILADGCDEALEAIAFMIAVALDLTEVAPPAPEPDPPPPDEAPPETTPSSALVPFVGAGVQALGAATPRLLVGPELSGGVEWLRASPWSPTARLTVGWATRGDLQAEGGVAEFVLLAGTLELCPLQARSGAFSLRPCAFGTLGRLRATGSRTLEPQSASRPWWVLGGSVLLTWEPLSRLRLTAAARAGAIGVRDTFEFEPHVFHRVPAWAPSAGIAAEVRFP